MSAPAVSSAPGRLWNLLTVSQANGYSSSVVLSRAFLTACARPVSGAQKPEGKPVLAATGYSIRLGRLFNAESGRSFITALDHGVTIGVPTGAEDVVKTLGTVIAGGP